MSQLFKLKNGTILLSTEAPGGVYNSAQLKKIADLCSKELAVVKATEDQRLALFVKESEVSSVIEQLRGIGLGIRNYQEGLHQPLSCLGELCEDHEQPALTTAMDLTRELTAISLQSSLKIGINGCARCCTPCHTLDISVLGEPGGYRVSLGGKTSQFPELSSFFAEGVPAKELPRLIKGVVALFKKQAEAGESLHDVLERCGVEEYIKALAPYSQDAAGRDDPFASGPGEEASAAAEESLDLDEPSEEIELAEGDLSLEDDAGISLESEDDLSSMSDDTISLEESSAAASDDDIALEDEGEISLDDDLALEDSDLAPAPSAAQADDTIALEADESNLDDLALEDEASLGLDDDFSLEEAPAPTPADDDISLEEDIDSLEADDMALVEDEIPLEPTTAESPADEAIDLEDDLNVDTLEMDLAEEEIPASDDSMLEAALAEDDLAMEEAGDAILLAEEPAIDDLDVELEDEPMVAMAAEPVAAPKATAPKTPELEDDLSLSESELSNEGDTYALDTSTDDQLDEIPIRDSGSETLNDDLAMSDLSASSDGSAELEELEGIEGEAETIELEEELISPEVSPQASPKASPQVSPSFEAQDDDIALEDDTIDIEEETIEGSDDSLELEDESLEDRAVRALESEEENGLGIDELDTDDIPELDSELAPDQLQKNQKLAAPRSDNAMAAAMIPEDDFDVDSSSPSLSDDEESDFEAKLEASIDEESRLLATDDVDDNSGERQAALSLLENAPAPSPRYPAAKVKVLPKLKPANEATKGFRLSGVSFSDESMKISFSSGAYMEIDLSHLELDEERKFSVGDKDLIITQTEEGFFVNIDGMKMFYPKSALNIAS